MTYQYDDTQHPRPWKVGQAASALVDGKQFNASAWWVKDAKGHIIGYMAGFNPEVMHLLVQTIALHNKGLLDDERAGDIDGHRRNRLRVQRAAPVPAVPEVEEASTGVADEEDEGEVPEPAAVAGQQPRPAVMPEF